MIRPLIRRVRRTSAVVVAMTLALGPGSAHAMPAGHADCVAMAEHGMPDGGKHHADHGATMNEATGPVLRDAPQPCDHCPPEQCATSVVCSGSLLALETPVSIERDALLATSPLGMHWLPVHSRTSHPPVPPPTGLL